MRAPVTEQAAALAVEMTSHALRLPTAREQVGPLAEAALRRRRRPAHLPRAHHRDRQRLLPPAVHSFPPVGKSGAPRGAISRLPSPEWAAVRLFPVVRSRAPSGGCRGHSGPNSAPIANAAAHLTTSIACQNHPP